MIALQQPSNQYHPHTMTFNMSPCSSTTGLLAAASPYMSPRSSTTGLLAASPRNVFHSSNGTKATAHHHHHHNLSTLVQSIMGIVTSPAPKAYSSKGKANMIKRKKLRKPNRDLKAAEAGAWHLTCQRFKIGSEVKSPAHPDFKTNALHMHPSHDCIFKQAAALPPIVSRSRKGKQSTLLSKYYPQRTHEHSQRSLQTIDEMSGPMTFTPINDLSRFRKLSKSDLKHPVLPRSTRLMLDDNMVGAVISVIRSPDCEEDEGLPSKKRKLTKVEDFEKLLATQPQRNSPTLRMITH